MGNLDLVRQQAIGFFKLVRDFAQYRTRSKLDIRQYDEHIWFSEIPKAYDSYDCIKAEDEAEDEKNAAVWIEVRKRSEPECPDPPRITHKWIRDPFPFDSEIEPSLLVSIPDDTAPSSNENYSIEILEDSEQRFSELDSFPEVQNAWAEYLIKKWKEWSTDHQEWKIHQRIFSKLHAINRAQERQGEDYELVIGLGILNWVTPTEKRIHRHVLTMRANLEFNAREGILTVGPPSDEIAFSAEIEMLDPEDQPIHFEERVRDKKAELQKAPWDRELIDGLLKSVIHEMAGGRGEYSDSILALELFDSKPRIAFAPALIYRSRSTNRMIERFSKIVEDLESGGEIPSNIKLLSSNADTNSDGNGSEPHDPGAIVGSEPSANILFPLPANDEQYQVVQRLEHQDGLLVQGPPGTGKSHTIANLICHLLASGQRVLVTAQTPRALQVLRDKLPAEIKPLCLSVLGKDRASMDELQKSVETILSKEDSAGLRHSGGVVELDSHLDEQYRKRAKLDAELQSIREAETRSVEICGSDYKGTAQSLAERVSNEKEQFEWFIDEPGINQTLPEQSNIQLLSYLESCQVLKNHPVACTGYRLPAIGEEAPKPDLFQRMIDRLEYCNSKLQEFEQVKVNPDQHFINNTNKNILLALAEKLHFVRDEIANVRLRPGEWITVALKDILADNDLPWKERFKATKQYLDSIENKAREFEEREIRLPEGIERSKLRADVEDLIKYLDGGGKLNLFSRHLNKTVKHTRYLTQQALVDGRPCDTSERLTLLFDSLEVEQTVVRIWGFWHGLVQPAQGPLRLQLARIQEHMEDLEHIIKIDAAMRDAKCTVGKIHGIAEPLWTDDKAIHSLLQACERALAKYEKQEIAIDLRNFGVKLRGISSKATAHPIVKQLIAAISEHNINEYRTCFAVLEQLYKALQLRNKMEEFKAELNIVFPKLVELIAETPEDECWKERIASTKSAWDWSRACSFVRKVVEEHSTGKYTDEYDRVQSDINLLVEKTASAKAWKFCIDRMTEHHRRNLRAWSTANKRIPKGRSKYASRRIRVAQQHMAECRDAIPAWVMPLYRVYDQIEPKPGMFDVIIIDEASQCSLDALLLLYMGKKLIVVGDDEQISPTVIIDQSQLYELINKHLPGNLFAEGFVPETSLFDLGRIWFENPIVLREHFRCMPEIIGFSNRLSYHGDLLPLTQYSADRLKPIETVYVEDGFRRGKGSSIVNEPEAECVVNEIVKCCQDKRYAGKTMGVISLLGDAQARKIDGMLLDRLSPDELEERKLICGNAYSFQGDERDVIFLSLVAARLDERGEASRSYAQVKRVIKQRYNVAASRAREQMWLFHSVRLDDLPNPEDLRRQLLEYCLNPRLFDIEVEGFNETELRLQASRPGRVHGSQPSPFESWFELDVYLRIRDKGYRVRPQFEVAKKRIDLVVYESDRMLAVECDGDAHHGPDKFLEDLVRQRQLERVGWTFWRVWGSDFYYDQDSALLGLWQELERLGIKPISSVSEEVRPTESEDQSISSTELPLQEEEDSTVIQVEAIQETQYSLELDDNVAEPVESIIKNTSMQPYQQWIPRKVPNPTTAPIASIMPAFTEIVLAEGPILKEHAIKVYRKAAGIGRISSILQPKFDKTIEIAVRNCKMEQRQERRRDNEAVQVLWAYGNSKVVLRDRGNRGPNEIPPSELAALMNKINRSNTFMDDEALLGKICEYLEISRLRSSTRELLESVLRLLRAGEWEDDLQK